MAQSPNTSVMTVQGTQDPAGGREGRPQSSQWPQVEPQGRGGGGRWGSSSLQGEGAASWEGLSLSVAPEPISPITTQTSRLRTSVWSQAQLSRFVGAVCLVLKYPMVGNCRPRASELRAVSTGSSSPLEKSRICLSLVTSPV